MSSIQIPPVASVPLESWWKLSWKGERRFMHLRFSHRGRQFFFLTFCVRGRRPVLSAIADGEKRPRLTRAGECVKALWLAIHRLNPALTASDFVIMPDHIHLLLIVNYNVDPRFNPLVFVHWFRGESARMISMDGAVAPSPEGDESRPLPELPMDLPRYYEGASVGGSGAESPSIGSFWEDAFWLDLSFDSRQLKAIRRYIHHNPLRALEGEEPRHVREALALSSPRSRPCAAMERLR